MEGTKECHIPWQWSCRCLWPITWLLGIKLGSSERAANALSCWTISQHQILHVLDYRSMAGWKMMPLRCLHHYLGICYLTWWGRLYKCEEVKYLEMGRLSWIIRELWHSVGGKTFNDGVGEESDNTVATSQGAQLAEKDKEPDPPPRASPKGILPCQHL